MPYKDPEKKKAWRKKNKKKINVTKKAWRKKNPEKDKVYYQKNKEKKKAADKAYNEEHSEEIKAAATARREKSKEKAKATGRAWRKKNKKKINATATARRKERKEEFNAYHRAWSGTPKGKLNHAMSGSMRNSLKGNKNGLHWESLVDYNSEILIKHLEKLFLPGMTWKNHGPEWHIDHVIPKSIFNYTKPGDIDFKKCWALSNLMPRWKTTKIAKEYGSDQIGNLNKNATLNEPFQPSLVFG